MQYETYILHNNYKETKIFLSGKKQHISFSMSALLDQIRARRIKLGLKQHDMEMRVGMSRQQYQRLETKGNPRLDTLELIAKGLNGEIMFIPQDKAQAVRAVLENEQEQTVERIGEKRDQYGIADDPWKNVLEDED